MKLKKEQKLVGLLRIALGWIFLWAFVDKMWGLGYATAAEFAWVNGGSPTEGFLLHATKGPFAEFFQGLAGTPAVDWIFMIGLAAIGVGLILGIGMKLACYGGAAMLALMFLAGFMPPDHNPFIDEHIVYILTLLGLYYMSAGDYLGYGKQWAKSDFVKKYPILK